MRLSHLHLPNLTPFTHASKIQQSLVTRLLTYKRLTSSPPSPVLPPPQQPNPTILTFTPYPVFTTGRRDLPPTPSSPAEAPSLPDPLKPISHLLNTNPPLAEYQPTLRGGQTTYHGPGQLVVYTILDLRRHNLTPRTHIRLLEDSVLDVLGSYGIENGRLEGQPGVWIPQKREESRKIAAVGVHLRRNVSSYGVGFNVTQEPMGFFGLIVPCGLEGREVTSLEGEGVSDGLGLEEVAGRFAGAVMGRLREGGGEVVEEVERIKEEDVLGGPCLE